MSHILQVKMTFHLQA